MWEFFDRIYLINLEKRKDRLRKSLDEFARVGFRAERFNAVEGENRHLAFNKSQHEVLKLAGERTLVLEDDVVFRQFDHLTEALNELPHDWDLIYLGANINGTKLERHSEHLFKIRNSFTTHAVGYSKKMAEWIVQNFKPDEFPIYDEWLRVNVQEQFKCYLIAPMIAWQRPDYSDIWQNEANYTSCFEEGNKLLV